MSAPHHVISRFLDDEDFDALELGTALADPEGREMLMDLIALRHLVHEAPVESAPLRPRGERPAVKLVLAAAGIVIALAGGYQWGVHRAALSDDPPEATVVVPPAVRWEAAGGVQ